MGVGVEAGSWRDGSSLLVPLSAIEKANVKNAGRRPAVQRKNGNGNGGENDGARVPRIGAHVRHCEGQRPGVSQGGYGCQCPMNGLFGGCLGGGGRRRRKRHLYEWRWDGLESVGGGGDVVAGEADERSGVGEGACGDGRERGVVGVGRQVVLVGQASACSLTFIDAISCESQGRKDCGVATAHRQDCLSTERRKAFANCCGRLDRSSGLLARGRVRFPACRRAFRAGCTCAGDGSWPCLRRRRA